MTPITNALWPASYVAGQPVWPPPEWDLAQDAALLGGLVDRVAGAARAGRRGLLALSYAPAQRSTALHLLLRASARLRAAGIATRMVFPDQGPDVIAASRQVEDAGDDVMASPDPDATQLPIPLVWRATALPNWEDALAFAASRGLVVAAMERADVARVPLEHLVAVVSLPHGPESEASLEWRMEEALRTEDFLALERDPAARTALWFLSLAHVADTFLPLGLLARLVGAADEDTLRAALMPWGGRWFVRLGTNPRLLTTPHPELAERLARRWSSGPSSRREGYLAILNATHPDHRADVMTVATLVLNLARGGKRGLARALAEDGWARVQALAASADPLDLLLLGRALAHLERFDRARDMLRQGLNRAAPDDPLRPALQHALGWAVARWAIESPDTDRYRQAARLLGDGAAMAARVGDTGAAVVFRHTLGHLALEMGDTVEARSQFEAVLTDDPRNVYALVSLAQLAAEEGRRGEADRRLGQAQAEDPGNLCAQHVRGQIARRHGDYAGAEAAFLGLLKAQPSSIHALHALGVLYAERGHWARAEACFRRVLDGLDPDNRYALHSLGDLHREQGEYGHARAALERVLGLAPDNPQALVSLALVDAAEGRSTDADRRLARAKDQFGASAERIVTARAQALLAREEWDEARRLLAQPGAGRSAVRWNLLATALKRQGDAQAARRVRHEALAQSRSPSSRMIDQIVTLNDLADFERGQGAVDLALDLARRSLSLDPENARTLRCYVRALEAHGDEAGARDHRAKAERLEKAELPWAATWA